MKKILKKIFQYKINKKNLKKSILIISIFTIFCLLAVSFTYKIVKKSTTATGLKAPILEEDIYACKKDSDCITVASGPCGCGGGGKGKAINKIFKDYYNINHKGAMCAAVMSTDPTCTTPPTCVDKRCTIETNNLNSCEKTNDIKGCISGMLNKNDSPEKCDSAKDKNIKNICLKVLAYKKEDEKICELIANNEAKQDCKDEVFYRQSRNETDYNFCYKISENSDFRAKCLFEKIYVGDDETKCKLIGNEEKITYCEDLILGRTGKANNDANICYKITDYSKKDDCIKEIAIAKMDLDLCEEIASSPVHANCIFGIAVNRNDYELCSQASYSNFSLHCRNAIIKNGQIDVETMLKICEIQEKGFQESCYEAVAIKSGDQKWCEKAKQPQKCIEKVTK